MQNSHDAITRQAEPVKTCSLMANELPENCLCHYVGWYPLGDTAYWTPYDTRQESILIACIVETDTEQTPDTVWMMFSLPKICSMKALIASWALRHNGFARQSFPVQLYNCFPEDTEKWKEAVLKAKTMNSNTSPPLSLTYLLQMGLGQTWESNRR